MLQIVLLAGQFAFLAILYLFIYRVIRSAGRELRATGSAAGSVGGGQARTMDVGSAGSMAPPPAYGSAIGAPSVSQGATSAATAGGVWALVVQKSPYLPVGKAYSFPAGAQAMAGRSPEMDIYLEDTFVSSKHALFEATANGFQVEDLRSTNGTQVNGTDIVRPHRLSLGDRVEVGDTVFQVEAR